MKTSFFKSIIIKILYVIIVPIILYDLLIILQSLVNPDAIPNIFGIKTFDIVSSSMSPSLEVHDVAIIKMCDIEDLKKDDVITFHTENAVITHRIIDIKNKDGIIEFITKGDNNKVTDIEKVSPSQIEGRYIGKIPKIGGFLTFLRNKGIFFVVIAILVLCYIFEEKKLSRKMNRKEKRELYNRRKKYLANNLQNNL